MPDRPVPPPQPLPTDKQFCHYVAEMCGELERSARRPRLRTLRYLLQMVRLEAERTGKDLPD